MQHEAAQDLAKFAPQAKVTLLQTNDECLQAVQQGRFDAYVLDQAILLGDATQNPDVKIVGKPFTQEPYGIGLRLGEPTFKSFINDWLRKIEADGEWDKAWKSTIGTAVPAPPAPPRRLRRSGRSPARRNRRGPGEDRRCCTT